MIHPRTLIEWLAYIETLHPKAIEMGLDRVRSVYQCLRSQTSCAVIIVGGTNGKGSTCAMVDAIFRAAGYRVGLYTSPHLLRYNERVRIAGFDATDSELCAAFEAVEAARTMSTPPTPLTYFEFGTLAALWLFARVELDVMVLEVGLGGRLDAVNIIDADVAVVTTVDIDHVDYLGPTREDIGREKAGIFRRGRVAICGDRDPPATLLALAEREGIRLTLLGRDYDYRVEGGQWRYRGQYGERFGLALPALRGVYQLANAATALAAQDALRHRLPISMGAIRMGLATVELPGRFQVLPGRATVVLDVAHNPQAARALADGLASMASYPTTVAVFGCMRDKDIDGVITPLVNRIDRWCVTNLPPPRGAPAAWLRERLERAGVATHAIVEFDDAKTAFANACEQANEADRIIVFGSFLTVAAALAVRQKAPRSP